MNIMALSHDLTRLICDQFNFVIRYQGFIFNQNENLEMSN